MSNQITGVVDILGNRFRKDQLVLIAIGNVQHIGQVIHVDPPPLIRAPDGNAVPTVGKLVLQIILPLEVQSGRPVQGVWVLEQPAEGLKQ